MSLTLVLDVVFLASFVGWWVTTYIQQVASISCVNFIAEMGRKTELSGGGLGVDGINLWMSGWGGGTEELLVGFNRRCFVFVFVFAVVGCCVVCACVCDLTG